MNIENQKYLNGHPAAAEYNFLFESCRAAFAGTTISFPDHINTEKFLELLQYHKLITHLYPFFKNQCSNFPSGLLLTLQLLVKKNNLRLLQLSAELFSLSDIFKKYNIPWICVKGMALAMQLYGDVAVRQSGDLDILVKEKDLDLAKQALQDAGYEPRTDENNFNKKQLRHVRAYASDQSFWHPDKKIQVELHWRLTQSDKVGPSTDELFAYKTDIHIGNRLIPTLDLAMHTLYLCRHGSLHLWFRLFWLWDVAYIFQHISEDESKKLLALARQFHLEKALSQSLYLSQQIFGVIIPSSFNGLKPFPYFISAAQKRILWNNRTDTWGKMRRDFLYRMRLQSDWHYWWAIVALRMNNPRDWQTIRLPESLFFLYYFIKPVSLLVRKIQK